MEWSHPQVRALLRLIRNPHKLERHPLMRSLRPSLTARTSRDALCEIVRRALAGHDSRLAGIVRRCDVEGADTKRVAEEFHLSPRQFFRYRAQAVEAVAVELSRTLRLNVDDEVSKAYLVGRLEMRPNCECCDRDLPPDSAEARICTFECTFCARCAEYVFRGICPNCGGDLVRRPIRPRAMLAYAPASSERVRKAHQPCAAVSRS